MARTITHRIQTASLQMWEAGLNLLFPPHCPLCSDATAQVHRLCASCWPRVLHMRAPFCDSCSEPFPQSDSGYSGPLVCGDCIAKPPPYERQRAALIYTDEVSRLIMAFKYQGQDGLAQLFRPWLQTAADDLLPTTDLIIPVPIHWTRLWRRGFNQAATLADSLDLSGSPAELLLDGLTRVRRTKPQGRASAGLRRQNLKGAIRATEKHKPIIRSKRILLIDDVATSGATLNACTKALLSAGAHSVSCLVVAKSLRGPLRDLMSSETELPF